MKKDYNRYCHSLLRIEEVPLFTCICLSSPALSNIGRIHTLFCPWEKRAWRGKGNPSGRLSGNPCPRPRKDRLSIIMAQATRNASPISCAILKTAWKTSRSEHGIWNKEMRSLIQEMIHYRNGMAPGTECDAAKVRELENEYRKILLKAKEEYEYVPANESIIKMDITCTFGWMNTCRNICCFSMIAGYRPPITKPRGCWETIRGNRSRLWHSVVVKHFCNICG